MTTCERHDRNSIQADPSAPATSAFASSTFVAWLRAPASGSCAAKVALVLSMIAGTIVPVQAATEPLHLSGSIDSHYQIAMSLTRTGNELAGTYSYTAVGKPLQLSGTVDGAGNLVMTETDEHGDVTGTFKGTMVGTKRLSGHWTGAKVPDKSLPFVIANINDVNALDQGADGLIVVQNTKKVLKPKKEFLPESEAVIHYPELLSVGLPNKLLNAKIERCLSLKCTFGQNVDEIMNDVRHGYGWLEEVSYEVTYNRNYLLGLDYTMAGAAAYPSQSTHHNLINTRTGQLVRASDAFTSEGLRQLKRQLQLKMDAEASAAMKQQEAVSDNMIKNLIIEHGRITDKVLDTMVVSDKGVEFFHDWQFPHVILALQPDGEYFIPYATIRQYIQPNGPLGVFSKEPNKQEANK